MPTQYVWADEWDGPAYRYRSPYRPISATNLPEGYTVVLGLAAGNRVIVTTEPLPPAFVERLDLKEE